MSAHRSPAPKFWYEPFLSDKIVLLSAFFPCSHVVPLFFFDPTIRSGFISSLDNLVR